MRKNYLLLFLHLMMQFLFTTAKAQNIYFESGWLPLGPGIQGSDISSVISIKAFNDNIYVGGRFSLAGEDSASNIARYSPSESHWYTLGKGTNSTVWALETFGNKLIVAGSFTKAGELPAQSIALYNPISQEWDTLSGGLNGDVYAVAVTKNLLNEDEIYVGGNFTYAADTFASKIAKYNFKTRKWYSVGTGLPTAFGYVTSMLLKGNDLYVAGTFTKINPPLNYIGKLNLITQQWTPLGTGLNNWVNSLALIGDDLYVGGYFTQAGGVDAKYIAKYNTVTETWSPLSGELNYIVLNMKPIGNDLFVGGSFSHISGQEFNSIARYNTITNEWFQLGNGLSSGVYTIDYYDGYLYAGGTFVRVNDDTLNNIARYFIGSTEVEANKTEDIYFQLHQNFPNPFNPKTKITWQTPKNGYIRLKVYDVLGNEVSTLVDEYREAGSYEIEFDGRSLSSGIYFYRLSVGNKSLMRKMILMK